MARPKKSTSATPAKSTPKTKGKGRAVEEQVSVAPQETGRKKAQPSAPPAPVAPEPAPPKRASTSAPALSVAERPVGGGARQDVPLREIDLENEQYKFRVLMRVSDLVESIREHGQQFPVLLRPHPNAPSREVKYQLISGFRRCTAISELGWSTVSAIVRNDLADDVEAFHISLIENEDRKTYNDLDRAYAILAYRRMGKSNAEVNEIFKVGSRQRQRLEELTNLPKSLQIAIADGKVSSTNAVRLMQHARKHKLPASELQNWIDRIADEKPSYVQLGKDLKTSVVKDKKAQTIDVFVDASKDGVKALRVRPIRIDASLSADQRKALVADLKKMIGFVEGLPS